MTTTARTTCTADILVNSDGIVVAVKYGAHAGDQWSVDELLEIVASDSRT
ncbi:hypothetical protein [Glaciihabitans sp. UYNi722]